MKVKPALSCSSYKDTALYIREAGVMALVQVGEVYITGGIFFVGQTITKRAAIHLEKSILTTERCLP